MRYDAIMKMIPIVTIFFGTGDGLKCHELVDFHYTVCLW